MPDPSSRRKFFVKAGQIGALAAVGGVIWNSALQKSKAEASALRPPGAKPEADFLSSCIKCGQCVDACPFDTLFLSKTGEPSQIGVPRFVARDIPCYMCEDIPCARVCPTGSLEKTTEINKARMGLAVLVDRENCIAFQGLRCEVCYRACPLLDKAITLNYRPQERTGKHAYFEPIVHSDFCTGCGLCEHVCILEESAIRVLPYHLAQGKPGTNYRLGWQEKSRINKFGKENRQKKNPTLKPSIEQKDQLRNALDSLNDEGTLYD
jgi:ferredoxin-type protein NapG